MANFYSQYPPISGGASANPSVGPNGTTAPTSSTEVAGINPSGNLQPLQTNAAGSLITTPDPAGVQHVIVDSSVLPAGAATSAIQTNGSQVTQITGTVPLPTGAATSANQTTEIASLSSIDGKTPALGQALSAASVPVVLPAAQITALTPPTTVTVTQATASNLKTQNFEGTPAAGTVTQVALTVGTTAVRLTVSGSAPSATRSLLVVTVDSASTASFYIGGSTVTNSGATRGIQISAGQPFITNNDAGDYFIISSTAAQTVYVLEQA